MVESEQLKILFFIESIHSGGKERRLVELIKGLSEYKNIKMELVLTREKIHYQEIIDTGIKIHYTIRKGLKKDPRVFFQFFKIVKKAKPDIIHVWGNMVAFYAIPTKVLFDIPMINNQITNAPLKFKPRLFSHKFTFFFSDKIIANTYAGLKSYNSPSRKSLVIYNGFDFNRINDLSTKESVREKYQIKTKYVVGMVASFSKFKDYTTYIKAAIHVIKKRKDVTFLCVGPMDDTKYRQLVELKHQSKIRFLGRQQNVENIMNICDIGVLATYTEGLSNSMMEYMALGKPVVASGKGGLNELISNGENGFIVESKNADMLSEKISRLLIDDKLRQAMGKKSKVIIESKFEINLMIAHFINEYHQICNIAKTL